jgi:hypothetical protein
MSRDASTMLVTGRMFRRPPRGRARSPPTVQHLAHLRGGVRPADRAAALRASPGIHHAVGSTTIRTTSSPLSDSRRTPSATSVRGMTSVMDSDRSMRPDASSRMRVSTLPLS